ELIGKPIQVLSRRDLEDDNGKRIFAVAENGKAVFLIPGDPFIATTHVTLRIEAAKRSISTRIIHGASIISAIIALSGLHNYKFGKTVTIPFRENFSQTPYNVIAQNKQLGLHTLCLLDLNVEEKRYLPIKDALIMLQEIEQKNQKEVTADDSIVVGLARAGSNNPTLKAGFLADLIDYDFGPPPMSLVFVGQLHFLEADSLIAFANAPSKLRSLCV
ncbi:MAG: diphthine synthase, partial [Crenarchaeota archaeon]|nr:diphthine synthase [Thermoproteota archaeon]